MSATCPVAAAKAAHHVCVTSMMHATLTSSSVAPNIFSLDSRKYFWLLLVKWLYMSITTSERPVFAKVELALYRT